MMKKRILYLIIVCLVTLMCFTAVEKIIKIAQSSYCPYYYFLSLPFPLFLGIILNIGDLKCRIRQVNKKVDWIYMMLAVLFLSVIIYSFYFKANIIMMLLSAYSIGCTVPKLIKKND